MTAHAISFTGTHVTLQHSNMTDGVKEREGGSLKCNGVIHCLLYLVHSGKMSTELK